MKLSDFGVKPWSFENASPAMVTALESVKGEKDVVIEFPGGRIDLWPEGAAKKELYISNTTENDSLSKVKNLALCLENFSGLTIEGNNTLVVLHGKMVSFALLNSEDVTLKNIRFDYEFPTMAELKIVDISEHKTQLEAHPDTRFEVVNGKVHFYGEGWLSNDLHTVIAIQPETHDFENREFIHANICVEDNTFECFGEAVLFARSVNKLWFNNNEVKYKPLSENNQKPKALFTLEHCKNVEIENNTLYGFEDAELNYSKMKKSEVKTIPSSLFKN